MDRNHWYRVVMTYDADEKLLSADILSRDTGVRLGQLRIPDAGAFAPNMTRLGSSNVREGSFFASNAESTARIDNVRLYVTSGLPHRVDLSAESREATIIFGNRQLSQVEGTVRHDLNRDGQLSDDEPGLSGQSVFLDQNANSQPDTGEPLTVTNDAGVYRFEKLRPGIHLVCLARHDDFEQTYPPARKSVKFRGSQYTLTRMHGPWQLCEADARAAGGHLVTINDLEENAWLAETYKNSFTKKRPNHKPGGTVWIGLHRTGTEWTWSSGQMSDFRTDWYHGEPYTGENADHVALLTGQTRGRSESWSNSVGRPGIRDDYPRGVIELPAGTAPLTSQSHAIALEAAEHRTDVDFSITRRQP